MASILLDNYVKMNKTAKILIKNMKLLMNQAGWTQAELAKRTKQSRPNLSNYMTGKTLPSVESLHNIAEAFGVTVADLFATNEIPEAKVHVERTTLSDEIRTVLQVENSKLIEEIAEQLAPIVSSLRSDPRIDQVIIKKAPKDKLEKFINELLRKPGTSGAFYKLLDEGNADYSTLRVEFLRGLTQAILDAGGPTATEVRKMLSEILSG